MVGARLEAVQHEQQQGQQREEPRQQEHDLVQILHLRTVAALLELTAQITMILPGGRVASPSLCPPQR